MQIFRKLMQALMVLVVLVPGLAAAQCAIEAHAIAFGSGPQPFTPFAGTVAATRLNGRISLSNTAWTVAYIDALGTAHQTQAGASWRHQPTNANGLNSGITLTFAPPVPANRIGFAVTDVAFSVSGPAYNPAIIFTVAGTATTADFEMAVWPGQEFLVYDPGTGVARRQVAHRNNASPSGWGVLVGTSPALVSSLSMTTSGLRAGDNILYHLLAIPSCLRVAKNTPNGTGSFDFSYTNVIDTVDAPLAGETLTTSTQGQLVTSNRHKAASVFSPITLGETVPTTWDLASASCVDENASVSGNPAGAIGSLSGATLTLGASDVRPEADIICTFNNMLPVDLSITNTNTPVSGPVDLPDDTVVAGAPSTYTLVVDNAGPGSANGAILQNPPPTGASCATVACTASGGAACPDPLTIAGLEAGVEVPFLPVNGGITVTLGCTIDPE